MNEYNEEELKNAPGVQIIGAICVFILFIGWPVFLLCLCGGMAEVLSGPRFPKNCSKIESNQK